MEDPGTEPSGPEAVASPPGGGPKSKLDTLSKEDLIKFAKKQIAAMQKMKAKCADFQKEVATLQQQAKSSSNTSEDSILIQELTERMDSLLLEKAETQQSLVLSRKELERSKLQAKDVHGVLQAELDSVREDHQRKIRALEGSMEESNAQHRVEVARFQSLLAEREQRDREEASEREERPSSLQSRGEGAGGSEEAQGRCLRLEAELQSLRAQLELIQEGSERESHQRELTEAQQEVENLREELSQRSLQHQEEMRALEEDCEVERERLLLLHEELTEQLALKDSYLQDVQEEDEEPGRGSSSGIARMLELSRCSQQGAPETQALEDLQAQNTMVHDELTLLSNVKAELEAELQRTREEFQTEREELEFKIDELQMCREGEHHAPAAAAAASGAATVDPTASPADPDGTDGVSLASITVEQQADPPSPHEQQADPPSPHEQQADPPSPHEQQADPPSPHQHHQDQQTSRDPEEHQKLQEELRARCEALASQRDSALEEHRRALEVLRGLETELGVAAGDDLLRRYQATKEEAAEVLRDLQEMTQELGQERDRVGEMTQELARERDRVREMTQELGQERDRVGEMTQELGQERDRVREMTQELARERDRVGEMTQELAQMTEENTNQMEKTHALELKLEASLGETRAAEASVQDQERLVGELTARNEEILSQLHIKETLAQELEEMVSTLTAERERTQDQLERLNRLQEENDREVDGAKQETADWEARAEALTLTVQHMSSEKLDLLRRAEEASAALSLARDEREEASAALSLARDERRRLDSEMEALGLRLERESSEKRRLEASLLHALHGEQVEQAEQAEQVEQVEEAQASSGSALEEGSRAEEALRSSADDVQDLRVRVEELESERELLKSSLEEAQGQGRWQEELQARVEELQKEKRLLETELEEVVRDGEALQTDLQHMRTADHKLRAENHTLQARLALALQDKEDKEEEETTKEEDREEESRRERRELDEQLRQKEELMVQLRREMTALQAVPSEEDVAGQFTEKMALLEKQLRDKDERMNKIKAVAVKAKKELHVSKKEAVSLKEEVESLKVERERVSSSVKDLIHGAEGYKNLQMDYDRQTEQLDKQREMVEVGERHIAELTRRLSTAVTQNETLVGEKQDLLTGMDTSRSAVRQLEARCHEMTSDLSRLDRELLAERSSREHKAKELSLSQKELEELTARLCKQQQQTQQTAQELEQLRKEAQQSSLMDMEMADYERLVKDLNAKMADKEARAEELNAQIHTHVQRESVLTQHIEGLTSQVDQGEEKVSKMKQLLVKTKKDLADAKKQEASHVVLQASLRGELEANLQQLESSKIQLCTATAECHRLQESLRSSTEQQHRSNASLQLRISGLQQETDTTKAELASTAAEYQSYKVRVHNVLKQKNKSSTQDVEPGRLEREQLCSQVSQLRCRLSESQQGLQSSAAELQQLHVQHDTLLERHNKILQESVCKEAELRERLLAIQAEAAGLRSEQTQAQTSLQAQAEAQRQAFREQVRRLQDEHRSTVDTLQGQLGRLEEQMFTSQSHGSGQVQSCRRASSDPQRGSGRTPAEQSPAGGPGSFVGSLGDPQSMAREEGEGMETTEMERSSPAHTPLPSLEQLLTSPDPKQEPFVWALEPTKEELNHKLSTATRSMEHMNSLLHETEATNAVLMEQIALLKSELRRAERNAQREKSVANLEYLKNVLLQFIFLPAGGSERMALLPVIHTMLQLSPDEKSKLAAIANGEEESAAGSRGSGWSSYLHSWSGIR